MVQSIFYLVLEFELRKAKETIHDLRQNITDLTSGNYVSSFSFLGCRGAIICFTCLRQLVWS